MHPGSPAQFPQAGVRFLVHMLRDVSQALESPEQIRVTGAVHAPVEKYVRCRKDCRAVHVVLYLQISQIPKAYRPHAAIAAERRDGFLMQRGMAVDAVNRLQPAVWRAGRYI